MIKGHLVEDAVKAKMKLIGMSRYPVKNAIRIREFREAIRRMIAGMSDTEVGEYYKRVRS